MRSMCGADAVCLAMNYQSLWQEDLGEEELFFRSLVGWTETATSFPDSGHHYCLPRLGRWASQAGTAWFTGPDCLAFSDADWAAQCSHATVHVCLTLKSGGWQEDLGEEELFFRSLVGWTETATSFLPAPG